MCSQWDASPHIKPTPLGTMSAGITPELLPTCDTDPAAGLPQLRKHAETTLHGSQPLALATQSSYSPTVRLPQKLVSKTQNLVFVEMSKLLPKA